LSISNSHSSNKTEADDGGGVGSRAPAVARVATVLRLLSGEKEGLGVNEIARRAGLVPSTAFHLLRALVDEGFVAFDLDKKSYRTGIGLLTLVRDAITNIDFPLLVQGELDHLALELGLTAVAVELDSRDRMVVVAISRSDGFISLHVNVGSRFPAFISATGRAIAAASNLDRAALKARFDALRWEAAPKFETWLAEVEKAKVEGVGIDRDNYIRGVTIMAALLSENQKRPTRSIALIGFAHKMTERDLKRIKKALLESTQRVAAQLR
jgi:DNA-binding IclR family transcriptional regulator